MVAFIEGCTSMAVDSRADSDSDDDVWGGRSTTRLVRDPPKPLIVGHNIYRFDAPILMVEMLRNAYGLECLEEWLFADSLEIFRALDGPCARLQCMFHRMKPPGHQLAAHRALDRAQSKAYS